MVTGTNAIIAKGTQNEEMLENQDGQDSDAIQPEAEITVLTVEGGRADLPCDITAKNKDDSVYLVLWYRKTGTPIYSYDSREMTDLRPDRPDLWSEPTAFGDRAHFRVSTRPAVLSVTGVQRFDAGTYTCRVDFRQSPTVYHHVKLDIIGELRILIQECTVHCTVCYLFLRENE